MPVSSGLSRANILGVGIHAVDMSLATTVIANAVRHQHKGYICVAGVHGVMEVQRSPFLQRVFDGALLVVPDGMPTVWIGRLQGLHQIKRVFGPDLMLSVISDPRLRSCSHFLYGGAPGVAERLHTVLAERYPFCRIVGTYSPPFRALTHCEQAKLVEEVERLQPDIIWVGLSTPKQERFMAEYFHSLHTTLMIGVGAAFDFHTGRLKDSPNWVKHLGLQWLHRLCQEPKRLWKRYLVNNTLFLIQIFLQLTKLRRFELPVNAQLH